MSDKLKELRRILRLSQRQMAYVLGIKQNAYSNIETGKVSLTDRNKNRLIERFSVNSDWLDGYSEKVFTTDMPIHEIALFGVLQNNPIEDVGKKTRSIKSEFRPRIPLTAAPGSLSYEERGVILRECEQMPIVNQFPAYDFTMFIKGDSMSPKYESGDEIACRWVNQERFIQWGKVHVLDTTQGIIVKKVYEDGDKIKCVSINSDYPPFSVPKEDIHSMRLVVGSLSIIEM
jgi:repressor LexA